jgi:hypothetical protein
MPPPAVQLVSSVVANILSNRRLIVYFDEMRFVKIQIFSHIVVGFLGIYYNFAIYGFICKFGDLPLSPNSGIVYYPKS